MKNTIIFIICFCLVISSSVADAYERNTLNNNIEILTLNNFVKLVCKNDITFQEILIDNLKLAYLKDLNLVSRDLILSVNGKYNISLEDSDRNGISNTVSISKLFPYSGTGVSGSYETSPDYMGKRTSRFTAMVSQPIAQNAFGYINRLEDRIIDLEIEVIKYQIVEVYEDYLATLIALYYQWYSDYANLNTAVVSLEESTKLLNNINAKKKYNIAYQSDVDKIDLQVIEKQENVFTLSDTYRNTADLIYQAAGYKDIELIPEFTPYSSDIIDFEKEYSLFIKSGRTYKVFSILEQKGSLETKRNVNALLPSVNLLFGYIKERTSNPLTETEEAVYAGFSLEFPFWQEKNKAVYKISKIENKKISLSSENLKRKLETDLKNIYNHIKLEEELIQSADKRIMLGQRIVKSETNDYLLARISLSDLIKSINDLESHKYNKVFHTVKLHTLRIEWLRLLDKLVNKEETGTQ